MMNQWRSLLIELLLFVILKTFLFFFLAFGESFLVKIGFYILFSLLPHLSSWLGLICWI